MALANDAVPLSILMPFVQTLGPIFLYSALLVVCLFIMLLFGQSRSSGAATPYCRGRFLSENEKRFLQALELALGGHYRVFAQVRLAEIIDVDAGVYGQQRRAALNKVVGKSVDFLLVNRTTLDPVAVIEVDDRTHFLPERRERDAFVNQLFTKVGLPLVRVPANRVYSPANIKEMLALAAING